MLLRNPQSLIHLTTPVNQEDIQRTLIWIVNRERLTEVIDESSAIAVIAEV